MLGNCRLVRATDECETNRTRIVLWLGQLENQCNVIVRLIYYENYGCVVGEIARLSRDRERISAAGVPEAVLVLTTSEAAWVTPA